MANQQNTTTGSEGHWCYRCRICDEVFTSSQGLAGHQHKHMAEGTWIRGLSHHKFFCKSANLPSIHSQLGGRKSTPTVLRGQGRFYRPKYVVGPRRLPGRPRKILDESQQFMVHHVPRFVAPELALVPAPAPAHAAMSSLLIQADLFAHRVNQLVSYGIEITPNVGLAYKSAYRVNQLVPYGIEISTPNAGLASSSTGSTNPSMGSTVIDDREEELDLELRL